ncbi:thioredoxin domain-containing protein 16 [Ochotona princeps]|uniref:thioredoxin domain-containing protein 16 n=1 Tax=Ochotona princeps TaxID=9978 RepID=UPI002714BAA4|nr:thioredoxin domain-containing protein 16 [Ochotona princeps]
MSCGFRAFRVGIAFVLMGIFYKSAANSLPELSPHEYFSTLQPGKASLAYFCQADSPRTSIFLEELNEAVRPLQDYGISVTKVNCIKEETSRYCGREKGLMKVYLFRGNILLREFPADTLFDENAIVAHVLFALLFNEVKYITTPEDLQNTENALKGKANIVFAYVRAIGTPEHRAVMEAAFVDGTTCQFALTTETALLESVGSEEIEYAHLYFFHCKLVLDLTQECRRILMKQPLTILNIHLFIKAMNAPLLTEVAEDPQRVSTVHLQLGLPLVFIVSRQATYEVDKRTAEWIAWRLLGKAGVLLLLRDSLEVNIPQHANVVFRRTEKDSLVEFLVLHDVDSVISHVENTVHIEEVQEDEEHDVEGPDLEIQDDEVAETVYRDRKRQLPLELTVELTEETFDGTVMASDTLVLFYAGWQAVSMAFLQSYIDVAAKLKGTSSMLLTRINCADWTNACTKQNVTEFPVVKMYKKGETPVTYAGMLGTEDLLKFIQLNRISYPVNITSVQEAEDYLNGELHKDLLSYSSVSVLGLFSPTMKTAKEDFTVAGSYLRGYVITGIYSGVDVSILSNKYATSLPALLLARHKEGTIESMSLVNAHAQDIVQIITDASLETFPEITVENLPSYLRLQKPLLILFSDGNINPQHEKTVLVLAKQKHLDSFTPCWLNLKNTPVGRAILRIYFAPVPPLPVLVVLNLQSGGQVFAFPSDQVITEQSLLSWLKKLEAGFENPITTLPAQEWKPPLPAYDFLSMMDAATFQHPTGKAPACTKEPDVQEGDKEHDESTTQRETTEPMRTKHWNRNNWFKQAEKSLRREKEL